MRKPLHQCGTGFALGCAQEGCAIGCQALNDGARDGVCERHAGDCRPNALPQRARHLGNIQPEAVQHFEEKDAERRNQKRTERKLKILRPQHQTDRPEHAGDGKYQM